MKRIIFAYLLLMPHFSIGAAKFNDHGCCTKKKAAGTCTGSPNCTACRNCSKCHYCVGGRTCGVCASKITRRGTPPATATSARERTATSSQCKAITKKGTQCSRAARSGGYCWQHGG